MERLNALDRLCSPRFWSKRFPAETIVDHHIKFIEEASECCRKVPCLLDIPYGSGVREKLDFFGTDLSDDSPIFVFIPGGYWQEPRIGRKSYEYLAEPFHKNGIKTILVSYGQCPDMTLPKIVTSIKSAAKMCIKYAIRKKSKGLYFCGHSAGAHLIAMLFANTYDSISREDKRLVKGVIFISGMFDLRSITKTFLNKLLKLDEATAVMMSPMMREISNSCETTFFFVLAENESPEFKRQTREFRNKLDSLRFRTLGLVVEKVDHFDIIECMWNEKFELTRRILRFIQTDCANIDLDI